MTAGLPYEAEADSLGIRLLSKAGYDPKAMPVFFKRLLDENRINESNAPEFLRSHPLTIDRISESSDRADSYTDVTPPDQTTFLMMQAKATASYGDNKTHALAYYKQLIADGDKRIQTRYGYALSLGENNEYDQAREVFDDLHAQYPSNTSIALAQADNELNANNIEKGLEMMQKLYEREIANGNHIVDIYYANALVLTTNNETAIPILKAAIRRNPSEPYPHILLSRAYGETGKEMLSFQERGEYYYLRGSYEFALTQLRRAQRLAVTKYDQARLSARIINVEDELDELKSL